MIVFKYLYRMMNVLGPLMDKYAKGERRLIDNKDEDDVSYLNPGYATLHMIFMQK